MARKTNLSSASALSANSVIPASLPKSPASLPKSPPGLPKSPPGFLAPAKAGIQKNLLQREHEPGIQPRPLLSQKQNKANEAQTKQIEIGKMPKNWKVDFMNKFYFFSKKPRDLNFRDFKKISFVPMNLIPNNKVILDDFIEKNPKTISSGVYFESGDLLLSKITPCLPRKAF